MNCATKELNVAECCKDDMGIEVIHGARIPGPAYKAAPLEGQISQITLLPCLSSWVYNQQIYLVDTWSQILENVGNDFIGEDACDRTCAW